MALPVAGGFVPAVIVHATRERGRALARTIFPRRQWRLVFVRDAGELQAAFREQLADAAVIHLDHPAEETWRAAALSAEFPSIPFVAMLALRPADSGLLARAIESGCVDAITEGVDEAVARSLVCAVSFSTRFRRALREPPPAIGLETPLQLEVWREVLAHSGTPVSTTALAARAGLSREHLSRKFAGAGGANLKRVIDLVRLIAAAELAKNPGYDVRDVARVLGYASASHLAVAAARISGTRPVSLSRLRTVDLIDRFAHGRSRSRG